MQMLDCMSSSMKFNKVQFNNQDEIDHINEILIDYEDNREKSK
jgi:hypothetical protein